MDDWIERVSWRQLRYFKAVVDAGSLRLAAERIFIAQPALTRQIHLLEESLGVALLERHPRGVTPTAAGKLLCARYEHLAQAFNDSLSHVGNVGRGGSGHLRVLHSSSVPLVGPVGDAVTGFLRHYPGVTAEFDQKASELQLEAVANGDADIGLLRLPVLRGHLPGVRLEAVWSESLCLAVPEQHRLAGREAVSVAELQDESFVFRVHRDRGGLSHAVLGLCQAQGFVPRTAQAMSRKTTLLSLIAGGFGISLVPEGMRAICPPGVVFIRLVESAQSQIALAIRDGLAEDDLPRRALAWLQECAQGTSGWLEKGMQK